MQQETSINNKKPANTVFQKCLQKDNNCTFPGFPCTSNTNDNKNILARTHQKQIQLSAKKQLIYKDNRVHEENIAIKTPSQFTHRLSQKGIQLSLSKKNIQTNQSIYKNIQLNQQKKLLPISQFKIQNNPNFEQKLAEIKNNQQVSFHYLNPLNIDRIKYDAKEIKIGGEKIYHELLNKKNPQIHFMGPRNIHFSPLQNKKSNYYLKNHVPQTISTIRPIYKMKIIPATQPFDKNYNFDYASGSYTQNVGSYNFHKKQRIKQNPFTAPKQFISSFNQSNGNNLHQNSSNFNSSINEPFQTIKTSSFYFPYLQEKPQTSILQNDIQQDKDPFNGLPFQNYSNKYKYYMQNQLVPSSIHSIFENVKEQCRSIHQDQNQKSQNQQIKIKLIQTSQQQKGPRKASFASSFAVQQNKFQQIENTKNMFLASNIDTSQMGELGLASHVPDSPLSLGNHHFVFNDNQVENVQILDIPIDKLQCEVQNLSLSFSVLKSQEQTLLSELQKKSVQKYKQLGKQIEELETLKFFSQERGQQIESLKELIRVKKIYYQFSKSSEMRQKYLDDENGWYEYILQDEDISYKLYPTQSKEEQCGSTFILNEKDISIQVQ